MTVTVTATATMTVIATATMIMGFDVPDETFHTYTSSQKRNPVKPKGNVNTFVAEPVLETSLLEYNKLYLCLVDFSHCPDFLQMTDKETLQQISYYLLLKHLPKKTLTKN